MPSNKPARPLPPKPTRRLPAPNDAKNASEPGESDPHYARFGRVLTGGVYSRCLEDILGPDHVVATGNQAKDAIIRMAARDPAEEMLIQQLVLAHGRVQRLTAILGSETKIDAIRVVAEHAERASNTYRRLMLALAEYRSPPRTGDTFAVVKQANFAQQQVIQNQENQNGNATNEQGCSVGERGTCAPAAQNPAALPAESKGPQLPSFFRPQGEALGTVNRSANAGG